ncbi:hypothetical protein [Nitrosovibrio tenuis]|uniref:Uncharacterized protein n=1 Tax=Nitrosovibrio tenuis TaxID=1233 RepID=A0A1H7K170_9PROT|nr:hypothetical protein [Nitrosovibrio tenuis]SEK79707.1 hypothetical protein SAMN05216387_10349 [Nitrosovibrio tenuis]
MPDMEKIEQYMALVDTLVQIADKQELVACAKLLAMNVAHYAVKYGELPLEERVAKVDPNELNYEQAELVIAGMATLIGVLGSVIQGLDEKTEH